MSYTCSSRLIDMVNDVMPEGEGRKAVLRAVGLDIPAGTYVVLYRLGRRVAAIGMADNFSEGVGISIGGYPDSMPTYELVGYIDPGPNWEDKARSLVQQEGGQ